MDLRRSSSMALAFLAFEDVFDHTCDATTMYATIRKADLAQLGTWKDNFEMVTLNEGCPGQEDEYGNIIFSAGSLRNLPLECGTQYSGENPIVKVMGILLKV